MDQLALGDIKNFLDEQLIHFKNSGFIENDPIQIPHRFTNRKDIEIAGFLTALISWGNRKSIINNALRLMDLMHNDPYNFVINHKNADLNKLQPFVHRTFNANDAIFLIQALKSVYQNHGSLEELFIGKSMYDGIINLRNHLLKTPHEKRSEKHLANPERGSAAKRINMFLRWMVRKDASNIDFGLWQNIEPSELLLPLDIHTSKVARKLGLLQRKQNDWKAVIEITGQLKKFDPVDPIKYDFALFGLGYTQFFK